MNILIDGQNVEWHYTHINYWQVCGEWLMLGERSEQEKEGIRNGYAMICYESPSRGMFMLLKSESVLVEEGLSLELEIAYPASVSGTVEIL